MTEIGRNPFSIMVRVIANGSGDQGSIPDRVMKQTQKMVLDASILNTQYYKIRIKGNLNNPGKGLLTSLTPRCSSYWKVSLQVTLDYDRANYNLYINKPWRWPWCNCYCRRKWTRWHEFKSWTWLIAFHIALIPVWIQLFSFQLWVNSRTV